MAIKYKVVRAKGKRYAAVVNNYRDPATGKSRTTCLKSFGNLDLLLAADPDVEEKLKAEAERTAQDEFKRLNELGGKTIIGAMDTEDLAKRTSGTPAFSLSEVIFRRKWEELRLHTIFSRFTTEKKLGYSVDHAAYAMCVVRLADNRQSKIKCWEAMHGRLFDLSDVSRDNMYECLDVLAKKKRRIINFVNKRIDELYERKINLALYDVTTYYFESFEDDTIRSHGLSKEHRTAETQVVMGLLIDQNGLPIDYELFPGNTHEIKTILKVVNGFLSSYGLEKITIVADCGLNSAGNIMALHDQGSDFIVTQSLRKIKDSELSRVLNAPEEQWCNFEILEPGGKKVETHSFLESEHEIVIDETDAEGKPLLDANGQKVKKIMTTRMVVNFSSKRQRKDLHDIADREKKAKELLKKGTSAIDRAKSGKIEFLKKSAVDANGKPTGEAPSKNDKNYVYELNTKAIEKLKKTAGYYAFITSISKEEAGPSKLYKELRSLWQIENCFRVMKSSLDARPVFVRTEQHIRGHFLICYLALIIEELCLKQIKEKVDPAFSTEKLVEFMQVDTYLVVDQIKRSATFYQKIEPKANEETYNAIYKAFGIGDLYRKETADNLSRKLAVSLRFNPRLMFDSQAS